MAVVAPVAHGHEGSFLRLLGRAVIKSEERAESLVLLLRRTLTLHQRS